MRATRRGTPDSAARLQALTRRAYTATAGHLDLDDDAGREFDRIVRGDGPGEGGARGRSGPPARRWAVSGRAVVVVLAVVAALAGAVLARAIALGPSEPVPVPQLERSADPAGGDGGSSVGDDGSSGGGTDLSRDGGRSPETDGGTATDGGPSPPAGEEGAEDDASPAVVVVHVAGAVGEPGVVTLPAGSRVGEAVEAAGGALPAAELAAVNLARPVQDGEQVYVPRVGEAQPGAAAGQGDPAGGTGGQAAPGAEQEGAVVDLNTADLAALDTLPGVGPAIAQRILEWREANGSFHSVDELLEVSGIGPATLERLRERVRV